MKKISMLCGLIMCTATLLTGCSNPFDHMPNLTEEESALIAEYAAGILIKHDKHAKKLASDSEIITADERAARLEASVAEFKAKQEAQESEDADETKAENDVIDKSQEAMMPFDGIAAFCGIDGFQVEYMDYMVCDSYPEEDGGNSFFAMDATEGNKLLVLRFIAENISGEDRELDMLSKNIRFRIAVNDSNEKSALSTLLLDDFSSYKDIVPAETGVQLVLIRELSVEEAANVEHISLTLKNESENATTLLK